MSSIQFIINTLQSLVCLRTVLFSLFIACCSHTIFSQNVKDVFYKVSKEESGEKRLDLFQNVIDPIESLNGLVQKARQAYNNDNNYLSFIYYEKLLLLYPSENDLRLEYAQVLFEKGLYEYSIQQLSEYSDRGGEHIIALEMQGNAYMWQARYIKAKAVLEKILRRQSDNPVAREGLRAINTIISPYLNITHQFRVDDQPLQSHAGALELKMYRNQFLAPRLSFQYFNFSSRVVLPPQNVVWWELGNRFHWLEANIFLDAGFGYYEDLGSQNDQWNYDLTLGKNWPRGFLTSISFNKSPYFTTLASIEQEVNVEQLEFKLSRPFEFNLNGEAAYVYKRYYDGNEGKNLYAYLMYSFLRTDMINIKLGYGYNYDDTRESRFFSTQSLEEVINSGVYDNIEGRYDPYFTPKEQTSHSVIANVQANLNSWIQLNVGSSISLYASSQIPYIYLGESSLGELELMREFQNRQQDVIELRAGLTLRPLDFIQIGLQFEYQDLFFYEQYNFSSAVNIRF